MQGTSIKATPQTLAPWSVTPSVSVDDSRSVHWFADLRLGDRGEGSHLDTNHGPGTIIGRMWNPCRRVMSLTRTRMTGICVGLLVGMLHGSVWAQPTADLLLYGGLVYNGTWDAPVRQDVAITGDRISFVGDARQAGLRAEEVVDVAGLMLTPGFIDMHSHAALVEDYGRAAQPFLYQGITTVAIGTDGSGTPEITQLFDSLTGRIGVNAFTYVGHGEIRERVLGQDDRAPTLDELDEMRVLVRQGMEQGAFGLSSGLFYVPGYYATTDEVIELARIAGDFDGVYDTHDRDLGATYQGVGYLNSIREAIRIGETARTRVIFSHFNAQGSHNYGRAAEGARIIDAARARGFEVAAAQHVYTATQSNLAAYTIPRWAVDGGRSVMLERFADPELARRLDAETMEMLAIRGGADKILFADPRPELNGRTLAEIATDWELPVPHVVRRIMIERNATVMNLDLYDIENTRFLAQRSWMMTCTDGQSPAPGQLVTHPRVYGAFTRKLRQFVLDDEVISMPFAIRSMTGLAADFLRLTDRGYIRAGARADLAVFDREAIRDRASYEAPHQYADGTVHVLVNGMFALRDGETTGTLAGRPLLRPNSNR